MIINPNLLIPYIVNWINSQCPNNSSIIVNFLHDPASILLSHICSKTKLKAVSSQINPIITSANCNIIQEIIEFADNNNAVIVSPVSSTKGKLARYHKKYNDLGDIYPLYQLLDSDIRKLNENEKLNFPLNNPQEDIEWAMKEDSITNIISSDIPPQQNKFWYRYTMDQKKLISKLYYREKNTRHKSLEGSIYCKLPENIYKGL